jgi:hypothetical protein
VPKKRRPFPPVLEILRAETGELVLLINGRQVQGNQTLSLLAHRFDNLGTVIPYEDLCLLIGHKSANSAATHVLRQYWMVPRALSRPALHGLSDLRPRPRVNRLVSEIDRQPKLSLEVIDRIIFHDRRGDLPDDRRLVSYFSSNRRVERKEQPPRLTRYGIAVIDADIV